MFFFFFKQKTAYEMRISDWSSDVCSSDLIQPVAEAADGGEGCVKVDRGQPETLLKVHRRAGRPQHALAPILDGGVAHLEIARIESDPGRAIGRASCRERVCRYV